MAPIQSRRNPMIAAILDTIGAHPWITGRELKQLLPDIDPGEMRGLMIRLSWMGLVERRVDRKQRAQWRLRRVPRIPYQHPTESVGFKLIFFLNSSRNIPLHIMSSSDSEKRRVSVSIVDGLVRLDMGLVYENVLDLKPLDALALSRDLSEAVWMWMLNTEDGADDGDR